MKLIADKRTLSLSYACCCKARIAATFARAESSFASRRNSSRRPVPRRQARLIFRASSEFSRGRVTRLVPRKRPASIASVGDKVVPSPFSTICTKVGRLVASNSAHENREKQVLPPWRHVPDDHTCLPSAVLSSSSSSSGRPAAAGVVRRRSGKYWNERCGA